VWAYESDALANVTIRAITEKIAPNGGNTAVTNSSFTTELGTATAAKNWTATATTTSFAIGDRIRFTIAIDAVGTMGGPYTAHIVTGGNTAGTNGDTYIQFTQSVTPGGLVNSAGHTLYLHGHHSVYHLGTPPDNSWWTAATDQEIYVNESLWQTDYWNGDIFHRKLTTVFNDQNNLTWYSEGYDAITVSGYSYADVSMFVATTGSEARFAKIQINTIGADYVTGATQVANGYLAQSFTSSTGTLITGKLWIKPFTLNQGDRFQIGINQYSLTLVDTGIASLWLDTTNTANNFKIVMDSNLDTLTPYRYDEAGVSDSITMTKTGGGPYIYTGNWGLAM
jgi:hypothetical protein